MEELENIEREAGHSKKPSMLQNLYAIEEQAHEYSPPNKSPLRETE